MKQLCTYEEYSEVLAAFKKGKARCGTNKLMTRDELSALIAAGKLYYDEIDGVLWFLVNEGYFYTANFYVPADAPLRLCKQDMDVMIELTGNQTRYNDQWEQELVAAGWERYDKYFEYICQLDTVIDDILKQNKIFHEYWEKQGFIYRKAVKADSVELLKLWEEKLEKHRYTITSMTDADLEEMERNGWCDVICDSQGKIVATYVHVKKNTTAYGFHVVALYPGLGLGGSIYYENMANAYKEGCSKFVVWIREDNEASIRMHSYTAKPTGKFYRQFVYRA